MENNVHLSHSVRAQFTITTWQNGVLKRIHRKCVIIQSNRFNFSKTSNSETKQPGTLTGNVKQLLRHKDKPLKELAWHSVLIFHLACTFGNVITAFEVAVMERYPFDYSHHPFSKPRLANSFIKNLLGNVHIRPHIRTHIFRSILLNLVMYNMGKKF